MSATRPKTKTISRHYKRRRADAKAKALNEDFVFQRTKRGREPSKEWLRRKGYPEWTVGFEVRPARLRFHYRVVAVDR